MASIPEHTIKAIFSKDANFSTDGDSAYVRNYMPEELLEYLDKLAKKEYSHGMVENEGVEWDIPEGSRVNIGLVGNVDGELGTFIFSFDLPSGKAKRPSFQSEE